METNGNKKLQKVAKIFECVFCDYKTVRKSSFDKHISSLKHIKMETNGNQKVANDTKKLQKVAKSCNDTKYQCELCLKSFINRSGLWKHEKTKHNSNKLILELINDNKDMRNIILEQNNTINNLVKNGVNNVNTNCMNNNRTFNLQFFLNETCKDAMNINEFVDSIKLQISDLEETGRLGYVDGISKVVINNLNSLNVHSRPIHCSDAKREVLYIKDNNQWVKENENKDKMKNMIKQVANKNIKNINEWVKSNPNCLSSDSKNNDIYLKIVSNSMSGINDEEQKINMNKIISRVAKEVAINK
jgi:hypothetical protein